VILLLYIMGRLLDEEVLFAEEDGRLSILPIRHPELWKMYKNLQSSTWTLEEIDFKQDIHQVRNGLVDPQILKVVDHVLGFFSGADTIVNENLAENFLNMIKPLEAKFFYGQQIQNENVHNETYSFIIDALYEHDTLHRNAILNAVDNMPCVKKLYDWSRKWLKSTPDDERINNEILQDYLAGGADDDVVDDLAYIWNKAKKMVAFACVEGILFSASFCVIFWLKTQGLLPGLTFSNELISVDEGIHRDYGVLQYRMLANTPPEDQILDIIKEAVSFMEEFVIEMLPVNLTNMNASLMTTYVHFTADSLLNALSMDKHWFAANPFPFMETISFNGQTNFFERRVGEYSLSGFEGGEKEDLKLDENY
jgi:ribonucleoside-diphosphate reductase beta chain